MNNDISYILPCQTWVEDWVEGPTGRIVEVAVRFNVDCGEFEFSDVYYKNEPFGRMGDFVRKHVVTEHAIARWMEKVQ